MQSSNAADTTAINRHRSSATHGGKIWLFGYGSLLFKADFPYHERRPASIRGWARRFWQGSHDHRGTADAPGRVVTLVPEKEAVCRGLAYLIDTTVLEHLDFREKNGYLRVVTVLSFGEDQSAQGIVYIATSENEAFLGPASERDIARHVATSAGPSGQNADYVIRLAGALRELSAEDAHVFAVERYLIELCDRTST